MPFASIVKQIKFTVTSPSTSLIRYVHDTQGFCSPAGISFGPQ